MLKSKIIFKELNDKKSFIDGIKNAAEIIATTYGGHGGTVMYQPLHGPASFTKDGFEVSRHINFSNPLENAGAKFLQEACDKIAFKVGDGTTTMAIILSALAENTYLKQLSGFFQKDIISGLHFAIFLAKKNLEGISKKINKNDYDSIRSVALVSSNYDTEVADFITNAYKAINNHNYEISNPLILIEESKTEQSSINIVEGMQLQRGIFSPQFLKKEEKNKMKIEFNNSPNILIFSKSINRSDIQFLLPIFNELIKKGKSCLIFATDFSEEIINFLLLNRLEGHSDWVAVKLPGFGDGQIAIAQDIAIRTGGKVIGENNFIPENFNLEDFLGHAEKISIERDITVIVGGKGNSEEILERCNLLKSDLENFQKQKSSYHAEQTNLRLQSLMGVICVIKLGGISEIKINETKHRVEDAIHATKHALQSGIVPGGGIDLLYTSMILEEKLKNDSNLKNDEKIGLDILIKILKYPFFHLMKSCNLSEGVKEKEVLEAFLTHKKLEYGIDVRNGSLVNFIEKGILNPSAVSIGILSLIEEIMKLLISCNIFILDTPEEEKNLNNNKF